MTITQVSSVNEIYEALSTAKGGDVIELAAGTYDKIGIWKGLGFDIEFDGPVTIRSADPDNQAVVTELALNGVSNLVFDDIYFDYDAPEGARIFDRPFEVNESSNITIKNSTFDGDLASGVDERADGFGTGIGLSVRKSDNVTVENNEFHTFYKAIGFGGGTDYVARGNDIHSIRADGLTVTKSQHVLIEDNHIHDFARNLDAGDHADMIQFWTNGNNEPITDVVIRGNHLDIGDGYHTQGIFMRNEAVDSQGGGEDMFYQRVTIEDNLIVNAHLNGIVMGETNDLVMRNNMLLHSDGGSPRDAGIRELPVLQVAKDSTNVELTGNTAANFWGVKDQEDWTVAENTSVQNLSALRDGYYDTASDYLAQSVWAVGQGYAEAFEKVIVEDAHKATVVAGPSGMEYDFADGYVAPFDLLDAEGGMVKGEASYDAHNDVFDFNGGKSEVKLGKLNEFRDTDEITVSMGFVLDENEQTGTLFNNHARLSAAVNEDTLILRVATEDEGFKTYEIEGVDMQTGQEKQLIISLDREADHLQVIVDDEIVLNDTTTDFAHKEGMHNWGWTLGSPWHNSLDGSVSGFNLSDEAQFQPEVDEDLADTAPVLPELPLDL